MRLRTARERAGKTQAQVAKEAQIPERAYQDYEYGTREPRVTTALKIADVLNADVHDIFNDDSTPI